MSDEEAERPRVQGSTVAEATDRRLRRDGRRRLGIFAGLAVAVFLSDQAVKFLIRATLEVREQISIFPGFSISHFENNGIAFGLFPGRPGLVAVLTAIALLGIGFALISMVRKNLFVALGGGALMGGSISNLVDRAFRKEVTDYLDPVRWPAFNIADVGIVVGAGLIVVALLKVDEQRPD